MIAKMKIRYWSDYSSYRIIYYPPPARKLRETVFRLRSLAIWLRATQLQEMPSAKLLSVVEPALLFTPSSTVSF